MLKIKVKKKQTKNVDQKNVTNTHKYFSNKNRR